MIFEWMAEWFKAADLSRERCVSTSIPRTETSALRKEARVRTSFHSISKIVFFSFFDFLFCPPLPFPVSILDIGSELAGTLQAIIHYPTLDTGLLTP